MERDHLICCLFGRITASKQDISSDDLKVEMDQFLLESKFTPLGTETNDVQLLNELIGELQMSLIGRGWNRKDRRSK